MPKQNVDFETLKANLTRKIKSTKVRVFQDPDGYEIIEHDFDDGTSVMMHMAQWNALAYSIVTMTPENIEYLKTTHG